MYKMRVSSTLNGANYEEIDITSIGVVVVVVVVVNALDKERKRRGHMQGQVYHQK